MPFAPCALFALVDCNNFFVSCERLFNPKLQGIPVVVLSGDQGCIVARSNEAKRIGIPMGAPFFEWEERLIHAGGRALSANFSLYGDLSQRVMSTISHFHSCYEIYSIDEAFIDFSGVKDPLGSAEELKNKITQWTGIPVSIGIGMTRTLAKLANYRAKQRGEVVGILTHDERQRCLSETPVESIWGIGSKSAALLRRHGVRTALELCNQDLLWLQKVHSVIAVKIALELGGESCFTRQELPTAKQSIRTTRTFKAAIVDKQELFCHITSFVERAASTLRKEHQIAHFVRLFITTSPHSKAPFYCNERSIQLVEPTSFTPKLIEAAHISFDAIYRSDFKYKRAGIILEGLVPDTEATSDLFLSTSMQRTNKERELMVTIDQINHRFKDAVHFGRAAYKKPTMRHSSPAYTTSFSDLLTIDTRFKTSN